MPSKYQSTLSYMFAQLPMYQRQGKSAFKKDLKNIIALCDHLQNPQDHFKSIHIAGTNGKGSTSHILASALQAQGLKVGVYTSPHYMDFRERIKVNGKLISARYVTQFIDELRTLFEEIKPSFFEMTVAMAFKYFKEEQVDIAIIEVGLGGRLDSTNIITPILSIITNISLDHQAMLGNTLPEIASEKAGIIKSSIPVLIGERQEEVIQVFLKKSKSVKAPIYFADEILQLSQEKEVTHEMYFRIKWIIEGKAFRGVTDLSGPHQKKNLQTALAALYLLKGSLDLDWSKTMNALRQIKKTTHYIGRWHQLGSSPLVIADSAHNTAGLKEVVARVERLANGNIHFVLGFVNDKEVNSLLDIFPKKAKYYFVKANIPRGLSAEKLNEIGEEQNLKGKAYSSVRRGLSAARRCAGKDDLIFVGGSIFVVAEVL